MSSYTTLTKYVCSETLDRAIIRRCARWMAQDANRSVGGRLVAQHAVSLNQPVTHATPFSNKTTKETFSGRICRAMSRFVARNLRGAGMELGLLYPAVGAAGRKSVKFCKAKLSQRSDGTVASLGRRSRDRAVEVEVGKQPEGCQCRELESAV